MLCSPLSILSLLLLSFIPHRFGHLFCLEFVSISVSFAVSMVSYSVFLSPLPCFCFHLCLLLRIFRPTIDSAFLLPFFLPPVRLYHIYCLLYCPNVASAFVYLHFCLLNHLHLLRLWFLVSASVIQSRDSISVSLSISLSFYLLCPCRCQCVCLCLRL